MVVLLLISVFLAVIVLFFALYNGIGPVPTSRKVRERLVGALPQDLSPIVELGAGFGGVTVAIARRCSKAQIIAYENSWVPFFVLWLRTRRMKNIVVRKENFWRSDLSGNQLFVCYLYRGAMLQLKEKLTNAVIVTHTFAIPGWQAVDTLYASDIYKTPIYKYIA
jgi:hypothetical protein